MQMTRICILKKHKTFDRWNTIQFPFRRSSFHFLSDTELHLKLRKNLYRIYIYISRKYEKFILLDPVYKRERNILLNLPSNVYALTGNISLSFSEVSQSKIYKMSILEEREDYLKNPFFVKHEYGDFTPFYIAVTICSLIFAFLCILNIGFCWCSRHRDYWQNPHTGMHGNCSTDI